MVLKQSFKVRCLKEALTFYRKWFDLFPSFPYMERVPYMDTRAINFHVKCILFLSQCYLTSVATFTRPYFFRVFTEFLYHGYDLFLQDSLCQNIFLLFLTIFKVRTFHVYVKPLIIITCKLLKFITGIAIIRNIWKQEQKEGCS